MPDNLLKLSVSKTKTYIDCQKKYKFTYVEKLPRKEWEHHTFGKFAHKVLEDFHLAYINGSTEPYNKIMSQAFKTAQAEYKESMSPEMTKECFDIINSYLKMFTAQKKAKISPTNVLAVEKSFELAVTPNLILNGMIDRIQIDDDGVIHVCDYKTVKNKKYIKDDFFQLLTYAYVIVSENPDIDKVRASYILLRHNFEYITKEFELEEIMTAKEKYLDYARQIEEEKVYQANPTPLCNFCDYLDICSEGKTKVSPYLTTFGEVNW